MDDMEELDVQLEEEAKLKAFREMLFSMDNEGLAKLLLNKSLVNLAMLLEENMATAADYNVIRAILKDNNIGIVPTRDNAMGKLKAKLEQRSSENSGQAHIIPPAQLREVDIDDFLSRH